MKGRDAPGKPEAASVFSNPEMSMNRPLGGAEGECEGEG